VSLARSLQWPTGMYAYGAVGLIVTILVILLLLRLLGAV
jgi:hypothetical protein